MSEVLCRKSLFGWVQMERIEDGDFRYRWWIGIAWFDPVVEKMLCIPIPFNWIYKVIRTVFNAIYWPTISARRNRIQLSILRRCIKGLTADPETGERDDRGYTSKDLLRLVHSFRGCTHEGLLKLHEEWVGLPCGRYYHG